MGDDGGQAQANGGTRGDNGELRQLPGNGRRQRDTLRLAAVRVKPRIGKAGERLGHNFGRAGVGEPGGNVPRANRGEVGAHAGRLDGTFKPLEGDVAPDGGL